MTAELYVGVISGTSVDGLDLALLEIGQKMRFLRSETVPLDGILRDQLLALGQPGTNEIERLGAADHQLGCAIGEAVKGFLTRAGIAPTAVAALGSHGQTIRHRPDGVAPYTLQIGDPNQITEATGITCVADFRRRDMAAGGQGAPLVPPFHAALFRTEQESRVILNIGGISNITVLSSDPGVPLIGFDTGPGNGLMDAWINQCKQKPFDDNGDWARRGQCNANLLHALLSDPYLDRVPPKSTGREHYNLDWLANRSNTAAVSQVDVQATLLELTAATVCQAVQRWAPATQRILVCGGGRNNATLMGRLAELAPCPVEATDDHGIDGDGLEAGAFAWLAYRNIKGLAGNDPNVSGASGSRILGAVYRP